MGRRYVIFVICVTLAVAVLSAGCDAVDRRVVMPSWFYDLGRMEGVNLPHLEPESRFLSFVEDDSFTQNISSMGWNTFRLPIEWDDYVDASGQLDARKIQSAVEHLRALVVRLRLSRRDADTRTLLIVDFHQYKFGGVCGGVGIPRGKIDETGLRSSDPNCIFKAFHHFWHNSNGVQDEWALWAKSFVRELPSIAREDGDWLTIAVETLNEPQFGLATSMITDSVPETLWNIFRFTQGPALQQQIDQGLIPFQRRFVSAMADIPGFDDFAAHSLFVFDPFLLDQLSVSLDIGPLHFAISADGRYGGMRNLWHVPGARSRRLYWLAAPHHYVGAMDSGFLGFLPAPARTILQRYPNAVINGDKIKKRMQWVQARMAEAGMESILGEWGTEAGLLNSDGSTGGYRSWIADSRVAARSHMKGALWWQYVHDQTPGQNSFYLLRSHDDLGVEIPWHRQVLKCDEHFDLVRAVFGHCPRAEARP